MALGPDAYRSRLFGFVLANHKHGDFHPPRIFVELAVAVAHENYPNDQELRMEFLDGAIAGYNPEAFVLDLPTLMTGFDALHQDAWVAGLAWGERKCQEQIEWDKLPTYDDFMKWLNTPFDEEEEELEML
jgi:hypothetical protein